MDAAAWVAVAAAAISLGALYFTWRQAQAAERQTALQEKVHKDSQQPYVWADFRLDVTQGSLTHLVVRNEGPTVAEDVKITFDPPLRGAGMNKDLDDVHAQLAAGLKSLPPGREMKWGFAIGHKLYADDAEAQVPLAYTVTITGRGPHGELPTLTYPLDLNEMREIAAPRLGTLENVTKAIDKVAKGISEQPRAPFA